MNFVPYERNGKKISSNSSEKRSFRRQKTTDSGVVLNPNRIEKESPYVSLTFARQLSETVGTKPFEEGSLHFGKFSKVGITPLKNTSIYVLQCFYYISNHIFVYLEESSDLSSKLYARQVDSDQLVNDKKHFNDFNGYDTCSYETMNGCKESQEESECEPNDNKTSYTEVNSKQDVDFLENDLNDQKNLTNRNGTKNIDVPSLKNSRSLPQITNIW